MYIVYDNVISFKSFTDLSCIIAGSIKKDTGISTSCPGAKTCSSKQKHSILLKYCAANKGVTLNVAVPVNSSSAWFIALKNISSF